MKLSTFLCILPLVVCIQVYDAQAQNVTAAETLLRQLNGQVIKSSVNGKAYRLFVSLPYRYASDTTHYPVLYQLDGFYAYLMTNNINSGMEFYGQTQPIIIVSIADSSYSGTYWYRSRWTDYTP